MATGRRRIQRRVAAKVYGKQGIDATGDFGAKPPREVGEHEPGDQGETAAKATSSPGDQGLKDDMANWVLRGQGTMFTRTEGAKVRRESSRQCRWGPNNTRRLDSRQGHAPRNHDVKLNGQARRLGGLATSQRGRKGNATNWNSVDHVARNQAAARALKPWSQGHHGNELARDLGALAIGSPRLPSPQRRALGPGHLVDGPSGGRVGRGRGAIPSVAGPAVNGPRMTRRQYAKDPMQNGALRNWWFEVNAARRQVTREARRQYALATWRVASLA